MQSLPNFSQPIMTEPPGLSTTPVLCRFRQCLISCVPCVGSCRALRHMCLQLAHLRPPSFSLQGLIADTDDVITFAVHHERWHSCNIVLSSCKACHRTQYFHAASYLPISVVSPEGGSAMAAQNCPVCWDEILQSKDWFVFPCGHGTCSNCYLKLMTPPGPRSNCPLCRVSLVKRVEPGQDLCFYDMLFFHPED